MSSKYLGNEIDIHGGGRDLIFPHHENEIAQSEAYSRKKPFVKYWIHTGFLTINGEKMSKSLGNFITVKDLLKKVDPEVFKLMVLSTHYRSPIDYNERILLQSARKLQRIYNTIESLQWKSSKEVSNQIVTKQETISDVEKARQMFYTAMDNDLNTSRAIASLFQLVRAANKAIEKKAPAWELDKYAETLNELGGVLGLLHNSKERPEPTERVKELIKLREDARRNRNWEEADVIREELKNMGVLIEDTSEGPKWRLED